MAFWFGGLLVESGLAMAFWYWGVSPNRDPFQPEGHNRRPPPPPPKKMATVADGTHPTGMHSCGICIFFVSS